MNKSQGVVMKLQSISKIGPVLLALLVGACGQIPVDNGGGNNVNTFPLTPGTRWEYVRNYYEIPFNDPSSADTVAFTVVRRVIGHEPAIDTLDLTIIDDTTTMLTPGRQIYIVRYWYGIDDRKLKEYGRRSISNDGNIQPLLYSTPMIVLDFPLTTGKDWIFNRTEFGNVKREVVDTRYYEFEERAIFSALVKTISPLDLRIIWMNWYSDQGMLYSHTDYGIRIRTDEIGNPIDSVYAYDDIRLEKMHIVE
jgi:hypothetical protein